jgi:hypothetical protein
VRIDLVGTTADFRAFGPRRSLPINHLLCENRRTAGRIGEDGLSLRRLWPSACFRLWSGSQSVEAGTE